MPQLLHVLVINNAAEEKVFLDIVLFWVSCEDTTTAPGRGQLHRELEWIYGRLGQL